MNRAEVEHDWLLHQRAMADQLPRLVDRVRAAAAYDPTDAGVWSLQLADALRAVGAALQAHVAADEHPEGFLPSSARREPRLIHALDDLRAEHGVLIDEVASAESRVKRVVGSDDAAAVIRAVDAVLDRIERHLDTAYRLAMEIANDDLGSGD